eukprot:1502778-Pleurochrysis_carterae.AAC.1
MVTSMTSSPAVLASALTSSARAGLLTQAVGIAVRLARHRDREPLMCGERSRGAHERAHLRHAAGSRIRGCRGGCAVAHCDLGQRGRASGCRHC